MRDPVALAVVILLVAIMLGTTVSPFLFLLALLILVLFVL